MGAMVSLLQTVPDRRESFRLLLLIAIAIAVFEAFLLGTGHPPFAFVDDLMWEVQPSTYAIKLEAEGRWLVYAWHRIFGGTSRTFNFHACIAAWCAASAISAALLVSTRNLLSTAALTLAISANPAVTSILKWPNTFLPMSLALLAGTIPLYLFRHHLRWWLTALAAGIFINMCSYQLFSFYLFGLGLVACVTRAIALPEPDALRLSLRRGILVMIVSAASVVAGMLATYALNYLSFGRFGLKEEPWRYDAAPHDSDNLGLLIWNLEQCFVALIERTVYLLPVSIVILAGVVVAGRSRQRDDRDGRERHIPLAIVCAFFLTGSLAPFVLPALFGIPLPTDRGGLGLYFLCVGAGAVALLTSASQSRLSRVLSLGALLGIAAASIGSMSGTLKQLAHTDAYNRGLMAAMARDITNTSRDLADQPIDIVLVGDMNILQGPANGEPAWGVWLLRGALKLENAQVMHCADFTRFPDPADADVVQWVKTAPPYPGDGSILRVGRRILVAAGPSLKSCGTARANSAAGQVGNDPR